MKKKLAIVGIFIGLASIVVGILSLTGDLFTYHFAPPRYDYGYERFGADFYTYVSNNAAMAAYEASNLNNNFTTAFGIMFILFGSVISCSFGIIFASCNASTVAHNIYNNSSYINSNKTSNTRESASSRANSIINNNLEKVSNKSEQPIDLPDISASDVYRLSQQLQKALAFVTVSGMRAYLQMTKDPVIDRILQLPDDQIKPAIESLIIKHGSWWCSCGAKNSINSTQCTVCFKNREG